MTGTPNLQPNQLWIDNSGNTVEIIRMFKNQCCTHDFFHGKIKLGEYVESVFCYSIYGQRLNYLLSPTDMKYNLVELIGYTE